MTALAMCFDRLRNMVHPGDGAQTGFGERAWSGRLDTSGAFGSYDYVVFDAEMTGLNYRRDSIIAIGAVRMSGAGIRAGETFYSLVRPIGKMPDETVTVHNITPDDLRTAPDMETVIAGFLDFIRDAVLVGHFLYMDLRFLNGYLKKHHGTRLKNPALDTHNLHEWLSENGSAFRKHFRGTSPKTDLFSVAAYYGIEVDAAHNALVDAFITAQLFQRFLWFFEPSGIYTLDDLLDIGRA